MKIKSQSLSLKAEYIWHVILAISFKRQEYKEIDLTRKIKFGLCNVTKSHLRLSITISVWTIATSNWMWFPLVLMNAAKYPSSTYVFFFLSAYRPSSGIFTFYVTLFKTVMVTKLWLDSPCSHREHRSLCRFSCRPCVGLLGRCWVSTISYCGFARKMRPINLVSGGSSPWWSCFDLCLAVDFW